MLICEPLFKDRLVLRRQPPRSKPTPLSMAVEGRKIQEGVIISTPPLFYWKSDNQKSTLSITQYKIPASKFEPSPLSSVLEGRRIQEAIIISTYRHCLRIMFFLSIFEILEIRDFLCHQRWKSVEYKRPTFCQGPLS